jgi:integrase
MNTTLATFIDEMYAPWWIASRKTGKKAIGRLKRQFEPFLHVPLDQLHPWTIEKWRIHRLEAGIQQSTCNRELGALKAAVGKAVLWKVIKRNPIRDVPMHPIDRTPPVRYLTEDEEKRLYVALALRQAEARRKRHQGNIYRLHHFIKLLPLRHDVRYWDHLEPMISIALYTGLRKGELFHLKWISVDWTANTLTITADTTKNNKSRQIPLNLFTRETLQGWYKQQEIHDLVFPSRTGRPFNNIDHAWTSLLRRAGIENFRFHDLRHSFASRLVSAGVDLNTVRELLGHSDIKQTLRYAHLAPEHKSEAVNRLQPPAG